MVIARRGGWPTRRIWRVLADVQQREGRIVRQGNKNPEVQVIRYVTEQSFDSYIWQAIATKAEFINQIMKGRHDVREMDDVGDFALSAAEVTALGTGSRWLIAHSEARTELTRLERGLRNHDADQRNLAGQISQARTDAETSQRFVNQLDAALPHRTPVTGDAFRIGLGGREYGRTQRPEATDALRDVLRRVAHDEHRGGVIGSFGGFPVRVARTGNGAEIDLVGVPGTQANFTRAQVNDADPIGRLAGSLAGMDKVRARHVARVEQSHQDITAMQARVGRPFRDAEALKEARERFETVDANLRAEMAASGQTLVAADPAAQAAAAAAQQMTELRTRLDMGHGFAGIGEVTAWAEADPELAKRIPTDAGAKWGTLSPGGQLVAQKDNVKGWRLTIPRLMATSAPMKDFRTKADALEFAAVLESAGIPWNTSVDLKTWRAPDGASLAEVVARLRSQDKRLDQRGEWKDAAGRAEVTRRVPERLRQALVSGSYRGDRLGADRFVRLEPADRDTILRLLADSNPDEDLVTADKLREFGLTGGSTYESRQVALAAANRLERDYRAQHPQPLDDLRRRALGSLMNKDEERARIDQILGRADLSGDYPAAATAMRALADRFEAEPGWGGPNRAAGVARDLADALDARAVPVQARHDRDVTDALDALPG